MTDNDLTPMMRQYHAIKQEADDALLLFRLGDFYELFYEDAVTASRELEITLTARQKERGNPVPMCGVPYHAADGYIAKLLRKGFKVAICDQMEAPQKEVKLVRRGVTRVITPGTITDPHVLEPGLNNYLLGLCEIGDVLAYAFLDLSTGEFRAFESVGPPRWSKLAADCEYFHPKEVLFPSSLQDRVSAIEILTKTPLEEWLFDATPAEKTLLEQFRVRTLDGFGISGRPAVLGAAGAVVHYVRQTQKTSIDHVTGLNFAEGPDFLMIDPNSATHLELVESAAGERNASLFAVINRTRTHMGTRLLRQWLLRPSVVRRELEDRYGAVQELTEAIVVLEQIREGLEGIQDLERLLGRVSVGTAGPRDLVAMRASLGRLPNVRALAGRLRAALFSEILARLDTCADLYDLLSTSISDEPPLTLNDGGVIRSGYNAELDELRTLSRNSKTYLATVEVRERDRTGISSLKVRFNRVFGYYIEISKANLHLVPSSYDRKQTLVGAERFTTPELKEYEEKILTAEERILDIERTLFQEVRNRLAAESRRIRQAAGAVAEFDAIVSFATIAKRFDYCKPEIIDGGELIVKGGRHPVVESLAEDHRAERFVPNDLFMNDSTDQVLIVTGPNMGGKSTYLRQNALLVVLAQIGSFVPARLMRFPLFDRIFTRIGAADNLARGRSTFMVEMTETALILNSATPRSLVILDEIGRGTSTFDGMSLAWAVLEFIQERLGAKTLFATHYHELTELAELLPGIRNYHVTVRESDRKIVFTRKVEPGAADKSYGIEVARLAGIPAAVTERAKEILKKHEENEHHLSDNLASRARRRNIVVNQLSLFSPGEEELRVAIQAADLDRMTPLEALRLLADLKQKIK